MRATRHNGRSGSHGTYNVKHNDRNFDVKNSDHIDEVRTQKNVYWDCYQGTVEERALTFSEVEKKFYEERYGCYVLAQNLRNEEARHAERNRSIDDVLQNKKTCPEETLLQLGNIDKTVDVETLIKISQEYFEEFDKRFGSNIHILDWALHLDESTPHIHERHVFDATNQYGEICPMQDKALEELGIGLPDPDKPKGRYNNRKMTFDATCRELFLKICKKHGLEMEMEPIYGGASYLEKADYIVQKLRTENERLTQENEQLQIKNDELVMKISDVEELIDDITNSTYDKACEVVTAVVKDETQKADLKLLKEVEKKMEDEFLLPPTKKIVSDVFERIRQKFNKARQTMLTAIKKTLANEETRHKNVETIKDNAREGIKKKLAHYNEVARGNNTSQRKRNDREEVR
ncbi:MAG: serine/arginine repetitive matrix protein 2 [Lachnospiraceae bacterium]|nr:serine/arginine repetitive matrix protein 2 [Lachnospiraceae bacterium]